jgi:hypothetical protein
MDIIKVGGKIRIVRAKAKTGKNGDKLQKKVEGGVNEIIMNRRRDRSKDIISFRFFMIYVWE